MERLFFEVDPAGGWLAAAAFALAALWGLSRAFRRRTVNLTGSAARLISAARAAAFLLLLLPLLRPSVVSTAEEQEKVPLYILLDSSRSMSIRKAEGSPSRWEQALAFLEAEGERFLSLEKKYEVRRMLFDGAFHPFGSREEPDGGVTAIGEIISEWRSKLAPGEPGALLLITDGMNNSGRDPLEAAAPLRSEGRRIYAVGVGGEKDGTGAVDASVEDIRLPLELNSDQRFAVTAVLRIRGLGGALLKLELYVDGKKAAERSLGVRGADVVERVEFERPPLPAGNHLVRVRVAPVPIESNVDNNEAAAYLKVRKGTTRVLYIESRLRYEYTFLRRVLRRMAGMELKTAVLRGPAREKLGDGDIERADVVILGDVPAEQLGTKKLALIAAHVKEGASLLTMGGYSTYGSGGYCGTPVGDILPFECSPSDAQVTKPTAFLPTHEGAAEDFLQIFGEKLDYNELHERYASLPKLGGYVKTAGVRPLASLLAVGESGDPLMASMEVGSGRVVSLAVDTTYHWAFNARSGKEDTLPCYERFWRRLILHLAGETRGEGFSVTLRAERTRAEPGEKVGFEVEVTDEKGLPVRDAEVEVELEDAKGARTKARVVAEGDVRRGSVKMPGEGHFTLRAVAARKDGGKASDEVKILSVFRDRETASPEVDFALLAALAERTGGAFAELSDARAVFLALVRNAERYKREIRRRIRLWSNIWVLVVFTALLALEWTVRRKRGLP